MTEMHETDTPRLTTVIPELVAMPLRDDEFKCVVAASNAIDSLLVEMLQRKREPETTAHLA